MLHLAAGDRGLLSRPSESARFRANVDVAVGFAASLGCTDIQVFPSPIAGGDGNIEFFLGARRG